MMSTSGESVAVALWRTYEKFFKQKQTLDEVVVLGFVGGAAGVICSMKAPIGSVATIRSLKMWSLPGSAAQALGRMEVSVVPGPAVRMYPIVSKGIVDGFSGISVSDSYAFRVAQFARTCTTPAGGVFTPTFTFMANRKSWARLSPRDRRLVMAVSGEALARASHHWDAVERKATAKFVSEGKALVAPSAEFGKALRAAWMPMHEAWIARADRLGVDGRAAYDYFRAQAKAAAPAAK